MATDYENFMKAAVAVRPECIKGATEATGDPRTSAVTKVQNAPIGTLYLQHGTVDVWQRTDDSASDWVKRPNGWQNPTISAYTIYVDPDGDDSTANDGTVTPVTTLDAAFARVPTNISNGLIQLSADTYDLGSADKYYTLTRGWSINGWWDHETTAADAWGWPKLATFVPTSETGWTVSKDSGTTPWIVDEFVGKFLFISSYGWYGSYPIIANTEHSVMVVGWDGGYDVGLNAHIAEQQTVITNPGGWATNFDGEGLTNYIWGLTFDNCNLSLRQSNGQFYLCAIKNSPYHGLQTYFGGSPTIYECSFVNVAMEGLQLSSPYNEIWRCAFANVGGNAISFYNSREGGYAGYCGFRGIIATKYAVNVNYAAKTYIDGPFYFNSVGRFCNNGGGAYSNVYMNSSVLSIDGTKPLNYGLVCSAGSTTYIKSTYAIEAATAANSFSVNGTLVSKSDMLYKYTRNYFGPANTRVVSF